jgi:ERCC4-related helicase
MPPIEPLNLSAKQWQFLSNPTKYINESARLSSQQTSAQSNRKLVPSSTKRQFLTAQDILARLNGSYGEKACRGVLLADDVGLGKTTVAALVAWVVASAIHSLGERSRVRILAPNDVMTRRWEEELLSHVELLQHCAPALGVKKNQVKGRVGRLSAGSIQVVKHSYAASDSTLSCDLLIVDEAHRAKGENTAFSSALKRQKKLARRILFLTATPFSIRLDEFQHMLRLIGGETACPSVRTFSRALGNLYTGSTAQSDTVVAGRLAEKAQNAVEALSTYVIRHGIDDLPRENRSFGTHKDWGIKVCKASPTEIELIMRMDRILRLAKIDGSGISKITNDPRFHVGWRYLDQIREDLANSVYHSEMTQILIQDQLKDIKLLRKKAGAHSKMKAVGTAVKEKVQQGEKVVLFCHHHSTAQELTAHLASVIPKVTLSQTPNRPHWRKAWEEIIDIVGDIRQEDKMRATFIKWLCADAIRSQTWDWLIAASTSEIDLVKALEKTKCRYISRNISGSETIAEAAQRLYHTLVTSKSSQTILRDAEGSLSRLPSAKSNSRVLGICEPSKYKKEAPLFIPNKQPDTIIAIFNSPFGPDVLIVTDKLSEGIDLHRYCRHMVHYELDPSPIRTVQRNGRIRRVNSWAAATKQPILYAYPAFEGTRDHRLVQIMKKRIDSFSLLLGGVQDFDVGEVVGADEIWRNEVISQSKKRLTTTGRLLRARK